MPIARAAMPMLQLARDWPAWIVCSCPPAHLGGLEADLAGYCCPPGKLSLARTTGTRLELLALRRTKGRQLP